MSSAPGPEPRSADECDNKLGEIFENLLDMETTNLLIGDNPEDTISNVIAVMTYLSQINCEESQTFGPGNYGKNMLNSLLVQALNHAKGQLSGKIVNPLKEIKKIKETKAADTSA